MAETIAGLMSLTTAVASNNGFDLPWTLFTRASNRSPPRSPISEIASLVRPATIGTREFALTRWFAKRSTAPVLVSSSSIARTGCPLPYIAASFSKLRLGPKIGKTAGSLSAVRNFGSSCQASSNRLAGFSRRRADGSDSREARMRPTSARGRPVAIATRDLLSRPPSSIRRLAALRTAASRTVWLSSRTLTLASAIRLSNGSITRFSAMMAASFIGSAVSILCRSDVITHSCKCRHPCETLNLASAPWERISVPIILISRADPSKVSMSSHVRCAPRFGRMSPATALLTDAQVCVKWPRHRAAARVKWGRIAPALGGG
jgi:hypothetical protein